jgi:hypothetical protein
MIRGSITGAGKTVFDLVESIKTVPVSRSRHYRMGIGDLSLGWGRRE